MSKIEESNNINQMLYFLNQPKFRLLGLEINNCPIEIRMAVDKSIIKRCGLRRVLTLSSLMRQEEERIFRIRNCVVSLFGGDLIIEPYSKFFPYRRWLRTRVLFITESFTLTALLIDFWSDGFGVMTQDLLDRFEALGDMWLTSIYDRQKAVKQISSQRLLDALINNVDLRPHGKWEINDTYIYSDLIGRREKMHPRGMCRILWEIRGDTTRFIPSELFGYP